MQLREPLIAFFLGLYFQLFVPAEPGRQIVGIDFGEPTRNCMGRGQICRIDQPEADWGENPEALGEMWTDSLGNFQLSIREIWWDSETDSLRHWLLVPDEIPGKTPAYFLGERKGGMIRFTWKMKKR